MEDSQVPGPLQIPGQGAMNQPQQADAWFKRTTPSAGTLPPQAQPTCPPSPPQQSGRGQMDEAEAPSILSLAQLLAVSWVTVAHQYLRKYSSEGAPIRSCTADHGPARAGSVDRSPQEGGHASVGSGGGQGVGEAVLLLRNLPAALPPAAPGSALREAEGGCLCASSPGTKTLTPAPSRGCGEH